MSKRTKAEVLNEFELMGFDRTLADQVYNETNGNEERMMDLLIQLNEKNQKMIEESTAFKPAPQQMGAISSEDVEINKAIEMSLKEQKNMPSVYEPLNPEQRLRKPGMPVGLKNIGNTCYVNPLFQSYFLSQKFVSEILHYNPEIKVEESKQAAPNQEEKDVNKIRVEASIKQLRNLRRLFAMMTKSHKKYADPTELLHSVVDDFGQRLPVGDQQDATEYHTNFLSRLEEAFAYQERFNKAKLEQKGDSGAIEVEDAHANEVNLPPDSGHFRTANEGNSFIFQHFFGKQKQFRNYTQQGERVTDESEISLGPLIVNISHKDLQHALEKFCHFTTDDYRLPNGETTKVEGDTWIIRPPEFMFIQLNRVHFDKESGLPVKINDKFTFEKEIFFDRFMLESKDQAVDINQTIAKLRNELEQKENSLQKILEYLNTDLDIIRVLGITSDFLQRQVSSSEMAEVGDPTAIGRLVGENEIGAALKTIQAYKAHLEHQRDLLKEQIVKAREEISNLCNRLHNHKYHLVSIVIHDGFAGSGHYYSFNRNVESQAWKRFNDIQVSDETEENVMKEAIGGHSNTSAYCLIYISDKIIQEELQSKKGTAMEIQDSRVIEIEKTQYLELLPKDISDEIDADNVVFHEEIEEYKFNSYLKSIIDSYKARYDAVVKILDNKDPRAVPANLNTFGCYLKSQKATEEDIFKWYLLDTTLQSSEKKMRLSDLIQTSPKLIKLLEDRFSALPKPYTFKHIVLTTVEEADLGSTLSEYERDYLTVVYTKFFIAAFLEERWKDGLDAARKVLDAEKDPKNYYIRVVMNIARIHCIKLALMIEKAIRQNEVDRTLELFSYLTPIAKGLLKADDIQFLQAKTIVNEAVASAQGKLAEGDQSRLKEEAYKFGAMPHKLTELDKILTDYVSVPLQEEMNQLTNLNTYEWREMDENAPSNQIARFMEEVKRLLKTVVDLHNETHGRKSVIKAEERQKLGFVLE